jgi:hypothetical protein
MACGALPNNLSAKIYFIFDKSSSNPIGRHELYAVLCAVIEFS